MFMDTIEAGLIIIGIVNGIKLFELPDKKSFIYFCIAVVIGIVFGALNLFGVAGVEAGLVIALSSSGLYKLAKVV